MLTDGALRGHRSRDAFVDGRTLLDGRRVATDGAIPVERADHQKAIVGPGLLQWRIVLGFAGKRRREEADAPDLTPCGSAAEGQGGSCAMLLCAPLS